MNWCVSLNIARDVAEPRDLEIMRLFHAFVGFAGVSTTLITAAPIQARCATISGNEILAANGDLKPLEKPVTVAKQRPRARFSSLAERHLRERSGKKKNEPNPKGLVEAGLDHPELTRGGDGLTSGGVGESRGSKPIWVIAPADDDLSVNSHEKLDVLGKHNRYDPQGAKKATKPNTAAPKGMMPRAQGNNGDQDDSNDDPDTDNASEDGSGTDDDRDIPPGPSPFL